MVAQPAARPKLAALVALRPVARAACRPGMVKAAHSQTGRWDRGATSMDAAAGGLGPIGPGAQPPSGAMKFFSRAMETKAEADAELSMKWQKWWDQTAIGGV